MTTTRRLSAAYESRIKRLDAIALTNRQAIIARVERLIATECNGIGFWFVRPVNRDARASA